MTLSQALRRIKKIKGQFGEVQQRAHASVVHLEENKPAFEFKACLEQMDALAKELLKLEAQVAVVNAKTTVEWDGQKIVLAQAIRELAEMKSAIAWLKTLPVRAQEKTSDVSEEWDDTMTKRIKVTKVYTCYLPEAGRAKMVSDLQDKFDKLNDIVETANHRTEF